MESVQEIFSGLFPGPVGVDDIFERQVQEEIAESDARALAEEDEAMAIAASEAEKASILETKDAALDSEGVSESEPLLSKNEGKGGDASATLEPNDKSDNSKEEKIDIAKLKKDAKRLLRMSMTQTPYFLNPFILPNAGITISYFDVGIAIYFLTTPVSYYLIKVCNASSVEYNAYSTLVSLPWSLKFIFGMISDGNPIINYRRKSWMLIGWAGFVCLSFYLAYVGEPSITTTTLVMLAITCLYLLADVCSDTLAVERARFETESVKGSLQTTCYTIRSFGCVIGAVLGALLYNTADWGWGLTIAQIFALNGLFPITGILPTIWHLEELAAKKAAPYLMEQLDSVWTTLQLRAVYVPITFIYIYGIFQIPNAAWTNFLILGLGFSDFEIGMLTVASAVLFWLGMVAYKMLFFDTSWRYIYIYTTILVAIFSLLQIILILRLNVAAGIPDFAFALGDTAIATFVMAIQNMPSCIMFAMLCPEGSEGVTYALLTTISNLSGAVAQDIGMYIY